MAEEPPRGSSYAIKLMYVCMYFKQGFYRPVTVLESLKRFLHIITRKKTNQQYEKISLCINQCWNSLNLINVQFLTNALGNYVWLTEKWSGLMKLKLFWRRSKTNSLSLGEGSCVLREKTKNTMEPYHQVPVYKRFQYQSLFILGHSYVSIFLPFCAVSDFLMGLRTFLPASHRPQIFQEVPTYHYSKKDEPTVQKHLTFHQPVRKFSKSN